MLWHCWLSGRKGIRPVKTWGDGGGGQWLVWMEWRPAGWSVHLPLLIFPCTIKSRSSLLAPAYPGGLGRKAVKRSWCGTVNCKQTMYAWQCIMPFVLVGTGDCYNDASGLLMDLYSKDSNWKCGEKLLGRLSGRECGDSHGMRWPTSHVLSAAASCSVLCFLWAETGAVGWTCDSVRRAQRKCPPKPTQKLLLELFRSQVTELWQMHASGPIFPAVNIVDKGTVLLLILNRRSGNNRSYGIGPIQFWPDHSNSNQVHPDLNHRAANTSETTLCLKKSSHLLTVCNLWIGVFKPNSWNRKTCILSKPQHRFQPNFAQR